MSADIEQHTIQLTDISDELNRLWNEAQGEKKIRASLFSFILYVQKSENVSAYQNLIKSVVSKFPCRVMMIINDAARQENYLRTSVTSETIGEPELKTFCELIQIEVAGSLIERVPFMILPLLLPDLPVYLLWTQDPATENAVLPHLEPFAYRIIFDSESCKDLQKYSKSVLSLMQRFHCPIGDLNWSIITGWRRIFAQVFNTQEAFTTLAQTHILRIQYNKSVSSTQKHPEIEAAYLQAWLASRMNWKFQSIETNEGNIRLTYVRPATEVIVLLVPQESDLHPTGSILSVEIESLKNKGEYIFKQHPQSGQIFIQYSEKDFCELPYSASLVGPLQEQAIIEEIFYPSDSAHYRDMLDALSIIPWERYDF